jgi:hypothetical protein
MMGNGSGRDAALLLAAFTDGADSELVSPARLPSACSVERMPLALRLALTFAGH